jgi:ubiquinone/menaquinone biosynthesis C-methylase UbiE
MQKEAQSLAVKRAQVEFHNFASLGEPDRAMRVYAEENLRRGAILRNHVHFARGLTPFLEIGANAGHTSYMLANEFGADGFALDISADSLRYGVALREQWGLTRAPVRVAGDALRLPFRDNSLRFVMACQMLSQFLDIESVFVEVKRVLEPGGVFFFCEEPLRRLASLRLYRCPYWDTMKPWERTLYEWGVLGYLVRDVIGAHQEESFGIRQNHSMYLSDWHELVCRHFVDHEYEIFVPERGWGERIPKRLLQRSDPHRSHWRAARVLGGTLAAFCRKAGEQEAGPGYDPAAFETLLECPDCSGALQRDASETLHCMACAYEAALEGGVYNLLPSTEKKELYPGDREDAVDFSLPGHEQRLIEGFHQLEGVFGNKYRWIAGHAAARLKRLRPVPQKLRIRGFASERIFTQGSPVVVEAEVNGAHSGRWTLDRSGLFVLEADVPDAPEYRVDIRVSPEWQPPEDGRVLTVNLSMIRLIPRD